MQKNNERKTAFEKTKNHWEMDVSDSVFPKAKKGNQLDNWIAKPGKEWPQPHVKINEQDY